jgi:hypothetical protein
MKRMYLSMIGLIATLMSAGCVSTPQTKALITPVGAIGVHSFAPTEPVRPNASEADRLARLMQERSDDESRQATP